MSWFFDKNGQILTFRVSVGLAVFGVIILIGGYILFGLELRNAQQPLNVDIPASTTLIAIDESNLAGGRRIVFYSSSLSAEEIAVFYDQKLADFQNVPVSTRTRERCSRQPRAGDAPEYTPGNGSLPFVWTCLFDNSNTYEQLTTIRFYPGQRNDATGENYEGMTRIDYEQIWQP